MLLLWPVLAAAALLGGAEATIGMGGTPSLGYNNCTYSRGMHTPQNAPLCHCFAAHFTT